MCITKQGSRQYVPEASLSINKTIQTRGIKAASFWYYKVAKSELSVKIKATSLSTPLSSTAQER